MGHLEVLIRVRNPQIVKNAYTEDSIWRNRDTFIKGHDEIVEFLTKKWAVEDGYRLRKELFAFTDNKVLTSSNSFVDNKLTLVLDCCSILLRIS